MSALIKIAVVSADLCSGCRSCETWCSFVLAKGRGFRPEESRIHIETDPQGVLNIPHINCLEECQLKHEGDPICVEMCPTGCLIYTDDEDLESKRALWEQARKDQPLFRLIVPWKYPYPWRPLKRDEL